MTHTSQSSCHWRRCSLHLPMRLHRQMQRAASPVAATLAGVSHGSVPDRNEARCLVVIMRKQRLSWPRPPLLWNLIRASGFVHRSLRCHSPPVVTMSDLRVANWRFDPQLSFSPISLNDYCKAATVIGSVAALQSLREIGLKDS